MTGNLYAEIIRHIFRIRIFNFRIRFIWLNATYIMLNLYRTTLYIYRAIGKTLCYHKWDRIQNLIFICSVFSDHDVTTDFIVVVNSMSIFAGVIYIHLRLFLLTYQFPIHLMFYRENHITAKYKLALTITFFPIGC